MDVGTGSEERVDYPDLAEAVGREVVAGRVELGVVCCGTGMGVAMAANKVPGVRAANCSNMFEAMMARAHNDANILALGARILAPEYAQAILQTWLETPFDGGRHEQRIQKISAMEARYGKESVE